MLKYEIGQAAPRTEDPRLIKGRGRYVDDFNLPYQAYAVMVRSPHAHAEIKSIDTGEAAALPGVIAVFTGADYAADENVGPIAGPAPYKRADGSPMYRPERPAITADRVRHVGQIVAMVVAESVNVAKDAADLVEVDYNPLPAHTDTGSAQQAPAIWPGCPDNESFLFQVGNADATAAALAKSARVFKQKFVISRVHAITMEPRGALGYYDPGEDRYTIHAGIQRPYANRTLLSRQLKVPESSIRIVTGDMGGSFGMKGALYPEIPLTAWASKRVGRPVKWRCDRSEGFMADDHARDNVTEAELGFDADNRITALRVRTNANIGAYLSTNGFGPPTNNIGTLAGVYMIPNAHVAVHGVFTNTSPVSAYRGAGRPEAAYVIERMMDIAARGLGMGPAELRQHNFIPPSAMPYKTSVVFTYDCGEFPALFEMALEKADYAGFAARKAASEKAGKLRGIGITTTIEIAARPAGGETVEVRFDPTGTVTVLAGSTQQGQGHETIYKQILGSKLGIAPENIRVLEGDTERLSFGTGTGGSRTATLGGSAVLQATEKVIEKARKVASLMMEAAVEDIALEDGKFTVVGTDRSVTIREITQFAFNTAKMPRDMELGLFETTTFVPSGANFPNSCHILEVEITPETGDLKIDRYTAVDDCGVELNPLLVKGQVQGGIVQGAGQAFLEQMVYDEDGQLLSGSFMDYCMPRADNFCDFEIEDRPVPTKTNPLGVKGVGESGTVGALAAVSNAVHDALHPLGITHLEMPLTPQRLWRAIREARG